MQVGNYPFTTIEPNYGITLYPTPCPCAKYGKMELCAPRYGRCKDGTRFIPVKMLDVAGLVPGASEGKGLGNQFLDDLRQAHVLLHVVDVSGTTNEKGEETVGYDPVNDVEWLRQEIHSWIFNNMWRKWSNIVRRHTATKAVAAHTLQAQLSGYGTRLPQVMQALDTMGVKEPAAMETWDKARVEELVWVFIDVRFPTILVLNKVDMPASDQNIARICKRYPDAKMVPTSALAECFLRKMKAQEYIDYTEGSEYFYTKEDEDVDPQVAERLKPPDDRIVGRLERIRDLVLFRYGGTGVQLAVKTAVEIKGMLPVYHVKNLNSMSCDKGGGSIFRDCYLIAPGTTVRELAGQIHPDMEKHFLYAEGPNGMRMGEDEVITKQNNIIKFTTAVSDSSSSSGGTSSSAAAAAHVSIHGHHLWLVDCPAMNILAILARWIQNTSQASYLLNGGHFR
eukprot:TRINITY_DN7853_c0_g1_i4.p1 TRINITY_DN7853_c0_g1~~TRINITY_DN7853_c0_g1_i4.p1  ORF type:complete len:451 (-),score=104.24 TRINITY_DN7853_c0_g1_i4:522-1874(-)